MTHAIQSLEMIAMMAIQVRHRAYLGHKLSFLWPAYQPAEAPSQDHLYALASLDTEADVAHEI